MNEKRDKWLRIGGIAFIWLAAMYANKVHTLPLSPRLLLRITLTLISITLAWEGNRYLVVRSREKFTGPQAQVKRIAFVFFFGLLYTGLVMFLTQFAATSIFRGTDAAWAELQAQGGWRMLPARLFLRPLLMFTCIFGVYEAFYYYSQMRAMEEEKKRLEREKLWSQLENLNQQVNPHFLFNTLNALSSVVTENPEEADRLLSETSKVYRYLLDNNKHDLVALKTELGFIRPFFQLLQLRFGSGISLTMPAPGHEKEAFLLPPLTLQLLVENAVKHNVHSKQQPLCIEIFFSEDGQRLLVKNNLQRKQVKPVSHRIGLDNIAAKYRLLQQEQPVVTDDGASFVVSLPLIHPQVKLDGLRPEKV